MWLTTLLVITLITRGIGAGIIFGIGILTNPVRHKISISAYAKFIKIFYKGLGVKAYAIITGLGLMLTIALLAISIKQQAPPLAIAFITTSLIATCFGFIGTAGAFPTMIKLWRANDGDEEIITLLLNRFEFWHWFSTISHLIAFCTLSTSMAFIVN